MQLQGYKLNRLCTVQKEESKQNKDPEKRKKYTNYIINTCPRGCDNRNKSSRGLEEGFQKLMILLQ